MAYKKLIKVSNVCQLLDKSNYPATGINDGVTWTNNGDGTITANGTTNNVYTNYIIPMPRFKEIKNDHKYVLFSGINDMNVSFVECILYLGGQDGRDFVKDCAETKLVGTVGFVISQGKYPLWQRVELRVRRGYTANDVTFKLQLFDLTEMYGAGHEPTTVEQFRQDFPDEMYDYSPYCWLTSYKRVFMTGEGKYLTSYQRNLTCKTKNLLNINKAHNLGGVNAFDTFFINGNSITATVSNSNSNVVIINLFSGNLPAGSYCFSCTVSIENSTLDFRPNEFLVFNNNDGSIVAIIRGFSNGDYSVNSTFNCSSSGVFRLDFYRNILSIPTESLSDTVYRVTFSNIQIERGDTVTDYVPYGHL